MWNDEQTWPLTVMVCIVNPAELFMAYIRLEEVKNSRNLFRLHFNLVTDLSFFL
jgi:hypothetical protein